MAQGVRLLSLAVLSSVMSSAFRSDASGAAVPFISRIAVQIPTHDLSACLESTLKATPAEDVAMEVAHLVDAIGSYAALESVQGEKRAKAFSPRVVGAASKIQPPGANSGDALFYDNRFKAKSSNHAAPETMLDPRQLQSMANKYTQHAVVINSLIRFLGKQGSARLFVLDGDLLPRKLLSKAANADCMDLLAQTLSKQAHSVNSEAALVTLWTVIHGSEQARAHFKRSAMSLGGENGSLNEADERTIFGLQALLA